MRGVWTALVTPFNEANELDLAAYRRILHDQAAAGISGVIPCGTTGESPSLTLHEKKILIRTALDELKNTNTKVIAGTGTNNTDESINLSTWSAEQGVAGIMLVTPYYNKPSQAGLEAHFRKIADSVSCEVILYNVPARTGVSLSVETVIRLSHHPKINTLKEATGNVALTSEILDQLALNKQNLDILSGDDATFLALLAVGAAGVISVASNLFPRAMVAIQNSAEKGDFAESLKIHRRYFPLFRDLFIESNPAPIKLAMESVGWCRSKLRLPLVPLLPANAEKLNQTLKNCGIRQGEPA